MILFSKVEEWHNSPLNKKRFHVELTREKLPTYAGGISKLRLILLRFHIEDTTELSSGGASLKINFLSPNVAIHSCPVRDHFNGSYTAGKEEQTLKIS